MACSDDADTADTTQPAEPIGPEVAGIDLGVLDLPPGDPHEDYVVVQDDTGVIELEVPEDWSFVTTSPIPPGLFPAVQATAKEPDIPVNALPLGSWDSPGVVAVGGSVLSERGTLDGESRRVELEENCEAMEAFDYDDGTYTGLAEIWTGCGPDQAGELLISVPVAEEDTVLVRFQLLTQADIDAATRIIESFSFTPTAP